MDGDDKKRGGTTKRFTREELVELANKTRPEAAEAPAPLPPTAGPTPMLHRPTLHDPLTTQLLAEIARRVQSSEADADEQPPEEPTHPNTRRRPT